MAAGPTDLPQDTERKLRKLRKKLGKVAAEGNEEQVARLQRKIAKLEAGSGDSSDQVDVAMDDAHDDSNSSKKAKKKKRQAENDTAPASAHNNKKQKAAATEGPAASVPGTSVLAKQCKSGPASDPSSWAEVGDVQLAKSGKAVVKQLYKEHADVSNMTDAEVDTFQKERTITVTGPCIKPVHKFEHTGLPANMLHATREFVRPSPIQSQCWPIILSGHDLIGIAATGSGKTLGFGLPALQHIAAQKEAGVVKGKGPFMLVMAPTRELACQIADVLVDAGSQCGIKCLCVYGGVPKPPQAAALKAGVEIVVGTPGRLEDLMNDGVCKLHEVTYLVLDEADRMLDLGFEPHIRAICSKVRADRQTLMFSATWPTAVQKLAAAFLSNPVKVTIGSMDLSASHTITQVVEVIDPHARDQRLLELLQKYHSNRSSRVIIFVLYKKEAPKVESLLQRKGWKAVAIHGDISQAQRTAAVESFKSGKVPLLIATDVAARGLDIPDVEVVINYSFPLTTEDYVHRIGRTGRAGKKGTAHTFFCAAMDKPRAGELINVLREAGQQVPDSLLAFGTAVKKKESKLYGAHFKDVDISKKATKMTFDSDDDDS